MGLLSSITGAVSDLNPVSLISNAAESLCDAVLPKQLELLGDLAGLGIDLTSGNWTKCLDDVGDLTKDLPQQLAALTSKGGQAGSLVDLLTKAAEPDAPPTYASRMPPRGGFGLPPASTSTPPERGAPRAPAAASSTSSSSTSAPSSTYGSTASTENADAFFAMSDKDIMDTVKNGTVPKEVTDDPKAMQQLQLRMNDYFQMNQMITQMIAAVNEMNKQIIQNLRV